LGGGGSAIVRLHCIVAVADEKKLLLFLKAQEAGVRGESGGERGEVAVRATTQLSNISSQTERRHLGRTCKTGWLFYPFCFGFLSFCNFFYSWRFYSTWCCIILPPDEKVEYSVGSRGSGMRRMK